MTTLSRLADWSLYTDQVKALELELQRLLEIHAHDDRRLARVYLSLAQSARHLMTEDQRQYLSLVERWAHIGKAPAELLDAPTKLSALALHSEEAEGQNTPTPFLYRLLEACARPRFTISPHSDADPIAWAVAIGIPFETVRDAVLNEYPELSTT